MTARLSGRVAGVPPALDARSLIAGTASGRSGWLRQGSDLVPGLLDPGCPGPGGLDFELPPAAAASQAGSNVQYSVAQGLGLGAGRAAIQAGSLSQADRVAAVRAAASHALFIANEHVAA